MAHERACDGDFRRRAARIFFKSVNGRLRKTRPSLGEEFLGKENVRAAREGEPPRLGLGSPACLMESTWMFFGNWGLGWIGVLSMQHY